MFSFEILTMEEVELLVFTKECCSRILEQNKKVNIAEDVCTS